MYRDSSGHRQIWPLSKVPWHLKASKVEGTMAHGFAHVR